MYKALKMRVIQNMSLLCARQRRVFFIKTQVVFEEKMVNTCPRGCLCTSYVGNTWEDQQKNRRQKVNDKTLTIKDD